MLSELCVSTLKRSLQQRLSPLHLLLTLLLALALLEPGGAHDPTTNQQERATPDPSLHHYQQQKHDVHRQREAAAALNRARAAETEAAWKLHQAHTQSYLDRLKVESKQKDKANDGSQSIQELATAARRRLFQSEDPSSGYSDSFNPADADLAFQGVDGNAPVKAFNMSQFNTMDSLPYRPLSDPWIEFDNIPWMDLTNLQYSTRDYQRWDSFDTETELLYKPTIFGVWNDPGSTVWGITNGQSIPVKMASLTDDAINAATLNPTDFTADGSLPAKATTKPITPQTYLNLFRMELMNNFYTTAYSWFRYYAWGNYDIIGRLKYANQFSITDVMTNTSMGLNENYNVYRNKKKLELKATILNELRASCTDPLSVDVDALVTARFDALPVDVASLPRNSYTLTWLEMYLNAFLDIQSLNHTIISRGDPCQYGPYDSFGLFANANGYNNGFSQFTHFFLAPGFGFLYGHYLRLLTTPMIRRIRTSIYASLTAQYNIYLLDGMVEQHSTCQWLLRIFGYTTHGYIILRSEAVLRDRGVWQDSDGWTTSNWALGQWTNSDIITFSETLLDIFVNRSITYGFTEYLSTYYGMTMDQLSFSMMHSPTQHIYNQYERIWKMLYYDLALNFFPGSGTFSGPSDRSYDLYDGAHGKNDEYDIPQYLKHLFVPHCKRSQSILMWDGSTFIDNENACSTLVSGLQDPSGTEVMPFSRVLWSMMQAGGIGYLPYDALLNVTLSAPYRTMYEVFSWIKGQERYNFITPYYQIGHSGEDSAATPDDINVCARLAGAPVPGSYLAVVNGGVTNSLTYVRIFAENNDDPFLRTSYLGVAGIDVQLQSRYVITQHQSFMLITSFLSGRAFFTDADQAAPWNTNIAMPLSAQELYADGYQLPTTVNSTVAIPPSSIFIIRHLNASIAIRVLRFDTSPGSNIPDADHIFPINNPDRYQNGVGLQEYSMTWQVDPMSVLAGSGRITIHHKHRSTTDTAPQAYRVAMLWVAGITRTDAEMWALQRLVRHAEFSETITTWNGWNATNQPWHGTPDGRLWYLSSPDGDCLWNVGVKVGPLDLRVDRHDVYQPFIFDKVYSQPVQSPLNVSPYYVADFNRTVNGKEIFEDFFDANNMNLNPKNQAFNYVKHAQHEVIQEHLTHPTVCVPGVDFPCYNWMTGDWSSCSASCGGGTQTRWVSCVDYSGTPTYTRSPNEDACGPKPPQAQSCNLIPC